jgi:hypothetical protein
MTQHEFEVPPRSGAEIASIAKSFRDSTEFFAAPHYPIIEVIELVLPRTNADFIFDVKPVEEMRLIEGYTTEDGLCITLREDVYLKASEGDGRARFTAAHELGHWSLHTGAKIFARTSNDKGLPAFRSSEWQADMFAAELLMPRWLINHREDTEASLMKKFGVSETAAAVRLDRLRKGK